MATYGLTAVHVDAQGRIVRARMQRVDGATNTWVGQPGEFEAHEVANRIVLGDTVYSIFIVPGGGTTSGAKFRQLVFANGSEGIELEEEPPGRTVRDLIQF